MKGSAVPVRANLRKRADSRFKVLRQRLPPSATTDDRRVQSGFSPSRRALREPGSADGEADSRVSCSEDARSPLELQRSDVVGRNDRRPTNRRSPSSTPSPSQAAWRARSAPLLDNHPGGPAETTARPLPRRPAASPAGASPRPDADANGPRAGAVVDRSHVRGEQ